jgi:acyl carrier protein
MRPGNGTDRRRSLPQVQAIFRDILDQPDLVLARESRAYTIEDWDSLALASLVATIERCYSR